MIVVRCKLRCQPGRTEHVLALLADTIAPSRALHGVISFDVGRDIHIPEAAIVVAVFTDFAASKRQESLAEMQQLRRMLPRLVEAPAELQVFDVLARRSFRPKPRWAPRTP